MGWVAPVVAMGPLGWMGPIGSLRSVVAVRRALAGLTALVSLLAGAAGAAGCGVGAESAPHALDPKAVPYGLLRSPLPTTSAPGLVTSAATVYLQGTDEHLVPVRVEVPRPPTVAAVLNALAQGPTEVESDQGLVSPASSVGPLRSGPLRSGVISVRLPESFANLGGQDQTVAAAQIVYTVTAFPGVTGVRFLLGRQPAQVPNDAGKLVTRPLRRKDYSQLGG
ncbi:MAG: GerMN domain-containing protein [Acidimicrobiales bacterium]